VITHVANNACDIYECVQCFVVVYLLWHVPNNLRLPLPPVLHDRTDFALGTNRLDCVWNIYVRVRLRAYLLLANVVSRRNVCIRILHGIDIGSSCLYQRAVENWSVLTRD